MQNTHASEFRKAVMDAVKGEHEGRELYRAIAERTDDPGAKQVFHFLADEEQLHMDTLLELLKEKEGTAEAAVAKMKPLLTADRLAHPIFSDEFKRRIKEKHFEVSALSIAMRLEKDAVTFYRGVAKDAKSPELAKFFSFLAEWEGRHYDALHKELAAIEEDYYAKNVFAPY